ncbi:unnamed protein product [Heterosigma akashiwo]
MASGSPHGPRPRGPPGPRPAPGAVPRPLRDPPLGAPPADGLAPGRVRPRGAPDARPAGRPSNIRALVPLEARPRPGAALRPRLPRGGGSADELRGHRPGEQEPQHALRVAPWSDSEEFQKHLMRVDDYLWVAEDGMKMQGYNGSQCWDTSFAIQGVVESGLAAEFTEMCRRVHSYLDRTQIKADEDDRRRWFRHESRGGWPFSTAAHGWPISDCTSEGLKGVLALRRVPGLLGAGEGLAPERLHQAAQILLSYQNRDGGWATYENNRGYGWYEALNPSDVFGDIMIDYSYVECSTACLSALATFRKEFPEHRAGEIEGALERGRRFVKSIQRPDGSWYGSWGVCFCYATWFGIEGLVVSGEPLDSPHITRAVAFLLSKQRPNGGWGESYLSCVDKAYSEGGCLPGLGDGGSGVVQTAWALLGLMEGAPHDPKVRTAVNRGVAYLMQKQLADGDWEQEGLTGVFNRNCGITYTAYRNVFPIWALGRYGRLYEGAAAERAEQAAAAAAAQTPSG